MAFPYGSGEDREMLASLPLEKLLDVLFLHVRNLWRVDGLYFLGIERRFGTKTATEIDVEVWRTMAVLEAKSLRRIFNIGENPGVETIIEMLRLTSWALDQPFKTVMAGENRAILSIDRCRTQEARLRKGLPEFPCKQVRYGYLENFAKTLNPRAEVKCLVCPPDEHPENLWCKWEFRVV